MQLEPGNLIHHTLAKLSEPSHAIKEEDISAVKQFVMMLIGYTELNHSLVTARFLHYKKLTAITTSKSLLMTNSLRSHLVAAHIRGNVANYQDPDPTQYGWIISRSTAHLVADLANKEDELGGSLPI